jgi:NitT/TauT family transport system ATP-binding protein
LLRSLYRASEWCADPANIGDLARLLAEPRYVGESSVLLERALLNRPVLSKGEAPTSIEDFHVPFAHAATFPWVGHALWFYSQMVRWGQATWSEEQVEQVRGTYRPDLYRAALASLNVDLPLLDTRIEGGAQAAVPSSSGAIAFEHDGFFDGRIFDPSDLRSYATGFEISSRPVK